MKKRMMALLLALILCAVPVLAEETTAPEAPAEGAAVETPAEDMPTGEETSAEEPAAPAGAALAGPDDALPEDAVIVPDEPGTLTFANLERRLRENNLNVLAIQESVNSLEELDYEDLEEDLRKQLNEIARAQRGMGQMASLPPEHPYYTPYDSYAAAQLQQGYDSLREQFDAVRDGERQAVHHPAAVLPAWRAVPVCGQPDAHPAPRL